MAEENWCKWLWVWLSVRECAKIGAQPFFGPICAATSHCICRTQSLRWQSNALYFCFCLTQLVHQKMKLETVSVCQCSQAFEGLCHDLKLPSTAPPSCAVRTGPLLPGTFSARLPLTIGLSTSCYDAFFLHSLSSRLLLS